MNRQKWQSRRWLAAVWAMLMASFLTGYSIITKYSPDWMGITLPLLLAIPSVFIAGDSLTKPKGE